MKGGREYIVKIRKENYTVITNLEDRKGKNMFPIFEQEKIAAYGMIISFSLSLGIRFFLGMLYGRLIHETDNMATTPNRLLKQCKLKFTHCYQLNNGVANVSVFVEKFLTRLSLGPFSFHMLYHISGQLLILSVVFSGVGVCRSIAAGSMFGQILPFYFCTLCNVYIFFVVAAMVDIRQKKDNLKINLIDYLENHLSNRMQVTSEDMCMLYGTMDKKPGFSKGLEILPIAGWLADKSEDDQWSAMNGKEGFPNNIVSDKGNPNRIGLEEEEAEALEELLKEFLSLS